MSARPKYRIEAPYLREKALVKIGSDAVIGLLGQHMATAAGIRPGENVHVAIEIDPSTGEATAYLWKRVKGVSEQPRIIFEDEDEDGQLWLDELECGHCRWSRPGYWFELDEAEALAPGHHEGACEECGLTTCWETREGPKFSVYTRDDVSSVPGDAPHEV